MVTGGAGFVGSHLVAALREQDHEVTVYDKVTGGDLFDVCALTTALRDVEVVYHFAANADPHRSQDRPMLDVEQNVLATSALLKSMRKMDVSRIVFASSSAVYGDCRVFPTPEDAPIPNQTSLYGASKMAAECIISAYTRTFKMEAKVFRFAPMLGEGYRRGHVRDFYDKIKANPERIEVLGDGMQTRCYVYVRDAMNAVIDTPGTGTFNVASTETASVRQSLDWICEELKVKPERVYTGTSWTGDKQLTLLDTSRLRARGWRPQVSIKEAVLRTVRSFE